MTELEVPILLVTTKVRERKRKKERIQDKEQISKGKQRK